MAKPKFFDWWDLERIAVSVTREPPETDREVLAWLRFYHLTALNFRDVYSKTTRNFGIRPRSDLGTQIYLTLQRILEAYRSILGLYPQEQLKEAAEILEAIKPI